MGEVKERMRSERDIWTSEKMEGNWKKKSKIINKIAKKGTFIIYQ